MQKTINFSEFMKNEPKKPIELTENERNIAQNFLLLAEAMFFLAILIKYSPLVFIGMKLALNLIKGV